MARARTRRKPRDVGSRDHQRRTGATDRLAVVALTFEDPRHVWAPVDLDSALTALREADEWLDRGYWIAGGLTYEFGALMHGVDAPFDGPLLVLGAFDEPQRRDGAVAGTFR